MIRDLSFCSAWQTWHKTSLTPSMNVPNSDATMTTEPCLYNYYMWYITIPSSSSSSSSSSSPSPSPSSFPSTQWLVFPLFFGFHQVRFGGNNPGRRWHHRWSFRLGSLTWSKNTRSTGRPRPRSKMGIDVRLNPEKPETLGDVAQRLGGEKKTRKLTRCLDV